MALTAKKVYSMLMKYIEDSLKGAGALKGEPGESATIEIGSVTSGSTASVINSGTNMNVILDFVLEKGDTGQQGEQGVQGISITGVTKTATSGLIDTYTITYSDGSTSTFQIANGTTISKLSELTNDTGFITNLVDNLLNYYTKTELYTKAEIDSIVSSFGAGIELNKLSEVDGKLYYDGKPIESESSEESSSEENASLITVEKYTSLPTISTLSTLTNKQIAVVYSDEDLEVDEETIVYPKGFYLYDLASDSWSEFKKNEMSMDDASDILLSLWNNKNCSTNLDTIVTKGTLEALLKSNNQKLIQKINETSEGVSFEDCNDMIDALSKVIRGEA